MFSVLIKIANREGLLKPGMNADVKIRIANRDSVAAVPTAALRADTDVTVSAKMLGIEEAQLRKQIWPDAKAARAGRRHQEHDHVAQWPRDPAARRAWTRRGEGAHGKAAQRPGAVGSRPRADAQGVSRAPASAAGRAAAVAAAAGLAAPRRRRGRRRPALADPAAVRPAVSRAAAFPAADLRAAAFPGRRPATPPAPRRRAPSYYQFGGDYWVIVLRNDQPVPIAVKTGLTDLEYSEIVCGLQPGRSRAALAEHEPVRAARAAAAVHLAALRRHAVQSKPERGGQRRFR